MELQDSPNYNVTSFVRDGSQFSSLLCSICVRISTGWFGWDSTKDLVVYRERSMSQAWGKPRMTVMGLWRHHSRSWGENASCLFFTWTHGVFGRSCSELNFGSWCRRFGWGQGSPSSNTDVDISPVPGPTRSHSLTISLAVIFIFKIGVGWGFTSSSLFSTFTELRLLSFTSHILSWGLTGLGSREPALRERRGDPEPGRGGRGFENSSRGKVLCWARPGAVPYREMRILRLVSSLDTRTGAGGAGGARDEDLNRLRLDSSWTKSFIKFSYIVQISLVIAKLRGEKHTRFFLLLLEYVH